MRTEAPARAFADLVAIGRVVKPQGRKGEVLVESFSDRKDRFPSLRAVYLADEGGPAREVKVMDCWPHKGRFVVKLDGVDSIDEAEALRGAELRIGEEDLESLPSGSYYHHQLRGLTAVDEAGGELGRVEDILETGAEAPVLVVKGRKGEVLVPLAETFIRNVDLEAGRVVVVIPELVDE